MKAIVTAMLRLAWRRSLSSDSNVDVCILSHEGYSSPPAILCVCVCIAVNESLSNFLLRILTLSKNVTIIVLCVYKSNTFH